MPSEITFFTVRFVNLRTGTFLEMEMNESQVSALKRMDNFFQVLNVEYLKTMTLKYTI